MIKDVLTHRYGLISEKEWSIAEKGRFNQCYEYNERDNNCEPITDWRPYARYLYVRPLNENGEYVDLFYRRII